MKADGGALVYIILAVISLIVSAVGKNKNKEHRPASSGHDVPKPDTEQGRPQNTWQKELEDLFGGNTDSRKPEVIEVKQEQDELSTRVRELNKYADSRQAAGTDEKGQIQSKSVFFYEDEEHEASDVNLEEFELRKAVIYAEVLNRKYF